MDLDDISNAVVLISILSILFPGVSYCKNRCICRLYQRESYEKLGERYISTSTLLVPPNIFLFPPVKANPP